MLAPAAALLLVLPALAAGGGNQVAVNLAIEKFSNPAGQLWTGYCCDNGLSYNCDADCSSPMCQPFPACKCVDWVHCDLMFDLCIDTIDMGKNDSTTCNSGWMHTGMVANDTDSMHFESYTQYGDWTNPKSMSLDTRLGFYFKYRVRDYDAPDTTPLISEGVMSVDFPTYKPGRTHKIEQTVKRGEIALPTVMTIDVTLFG